MEISITSDFFAFHVNLWEFQIMNGGDFTGDITNQIHAIILYISVLIQVTLP